MVANQILASGGLWLNLGGTEILIDPGPGSIVQATKRKLKPNKLSAIVLSHRHLDHAGDVNIMIEAMAHSGFRRQGWFFAPEDALSGEPVIQTYLREYLEGIEILQEGKTYSVGDVSFSTPVRHIHPVETYGMFFKTNRHTFAYIADTGYFDELSSHYKGAELLIINVVFLEEGHPFQHLSVPDAGRIIAAIRPKVALLTHFGIGVWKAHPWEVAQKLSEETGIRVVAARDGMKFDLSQVYESA
jgi:ribonuclease BN (tRNA processing enzyme)